jgi:hypothetical protein
MHIPKTEIEMEVKILCNKLSPLKPTQRIKLRILRNQLVPIASMMSQILHGFL